MSNDRAKRAKNNIISGLLLRLIMMVLPFFVRTAIIYSLGEQFAGLNNLFSSILQVLNLAELGFSSAIVYHMYKPIANGDTDKVNALLNYYKRVYRVTGVIIFIAGIAIMPGLPNFISGSWPENINIYLVYFLYLLDSSISYFLFAYMGSLLNAMQRLDLANTVQLIVNIMKYATQFLAIVVFKDFYMSVACLAVFSALTNILTMFVARHKFPEYCPQGEIPKALKKSIRKQVGGLMIGKIGDTSRNSLDSIIISSFLGLTAVAIYSNYYFIFSAIYGVMLVITHGMQAGVGNSIAMENSEKNYEDLLSIQLLFSWVICVICSCLIGLFQPFMKIWVGEDFLLPTLDMILLVAYFYILNINNARNLYFSGRGLWWKGKITFLLEAGFNLLLNIGLGLWLGTTGVILATIFTILVFNFVFRTNILFREYFKRSPRAFYACQVIYTIITFVCCGISYVVCQALPYENNIWGLVIRGVACMAVGMFFVVPLFRTTTFYGAKKTIARLLKKRR